ncbi:hypothetical protein O181_051297 [Austropuccinia psidii MF-1]|uniref:Uncharacterized protein n=1 Tax=Austropuccinia psidii MF-1 TaxID=1389203 RepID=A0A9Q3E0P0_9BASI|nr:hypothetical protein [Austropuccinia psidii MF-1]
MRRISDSPTNPDAEGSYKLDGGEVELVNPLIYHHSSTSPPQPATKRFQSQVIPSTPRNFQAFLFTIPSSISLPSPNPSTERPSLASQLRLSPIPQPRKSRMVTS